MEKRSIIVFADKFFGNFAVTCSPENKDKVRQCIERHYPAWTKSYMGMVGVSPQNMVMEYVNMMSELLDDGTLEYVPGCKIIDLSGGADAGQN